MIKIVNYHGLVLSGVKQKYNYLMDLLLKARLRLKVLGIKIEMLQFRLLSTIWIKNKQSIKY